MNIYAQTARSERTATGNSLRQRVEYHQPHPRVNPHRRIFPGRRGRRPAQPAAPSCIAVGLSLLVILLVLQGCNLPPKDRRPAVAFAERWARQIVEARYAEAAA